MHGIRIILIEIGVTHPNTTRRNHNDLFHLWRIIRKETIIIADKIIDGII
mgnify:CR=1 FL=1